MTFLKESNSVLVVLDKEIANDDITDFVVATKKPLKNAEQLVIASSTKDLETCKYLWLGT